MKNYFFRDAWVEENDRIVSERRVLKSDGVQKLGQILEAQRVNEREKESLLHELHEGRQKVLFIYYVSTCIAQNLMT